MEQEDPDRTAPDETGHEAVPPSDQRPTDEGGHRERNRDRRQKELRDDAQAAVLDEILRVARPVGAAAAAEDPTGMRMPEAAERLDRAFAEAGVRAVRVALTVRELMVLAMVCDPHHDVALDAHLAENGKDVADGGIGLEGAVREQPVVTDGDPDTGQDIADREDRQRRHAHASVPKENDGSEETEDR